MKNKKYIVTEDVVSVRLDKYLSMVDEDFTRSRIQNLVEEGNILINGKLAKNNSKLKLNDEIDINYVDDSECTAKAENIDLDIVYEDNDVIVINKQKGIVVHPSLSNTSGTIVNGLLYHCKDLSGINGVLRPGIVHRIDKDTTGLLIVAKNDKAHLSLSEQLKNKTVNRLYYALVHGVIEHDFGTIDAPIGRDPKDRQKMCVTSKNSKDAVTHFKVLERFKEFTFVECRLETGRTHQIRVHMQYIKHPIVGDDKYSYRKTRNDTNGQMLHAFELNFVHPTTNEEKKVSVGLPKYFEDILEELRQS